MIFEDGVFVVCNPLSSTVLYGLYRFYFIIVVYCMYESRLSHTTNNNDNHRI
jgi:hypothetical protein